MVNGDNAQPPELNVLGEVVTVFGGEQKGKPFEVHLQEGNKGGGPPPHYHPWDEAFFVLEGEVRVEAGGQAADVGPGGYVHIPGGTLHAYENLTDTARLLAVVSDPLGGQVFREMDAEVRSLPDDLHKVFEIGRRHGVVFPQAENEAKT